MRKDVKDAVIKAVKFLLLLAALYYGLDYKFEMIKRYPSMMMATAAEMPQTEVSEPVNGFVPSWKVGQRWVLEASYRDLRVEGEAWMPSLQWIFKVRAIKNVDGQDCYALHIFGRKTSQKNQAILYLSVKDLRPVKVIDVFPTASGVKYQERDIDPNSKEPLVAEGTPIPYDLPSFPLEKVDNRAQAADGFGAYNRSSSTNANKYSRIRNVGGISFKRTLSQKSKTPEKQYADAFAAYANGTRNQGQRFQVEIDEDRSDNKLTQLWQQGQPWAVSGNNKDRKIRLVPESELVHNNGGEN